MVYLISVLVLVSPLCYAMLLISPFSRRTKVTIGVASFIVLVSLPLVFVIFSPRLGM